VIHLPALIWHPTTACGQRHGSQIELVVVHRWGVRYVDQPGEEKSYAGVVAYFTHPANRASAHVVYPGSAVENEATQMVRWADYAWAEAAYNPVSVEVESADAIWLGHDEYGFKQLARMVAAMLHYHGLPPVWSHRRGFCRHADLGSAGGGHTECPTTDLALWRRFCGLVQAEYERGGFRERWGR
jgi:N-acetylmuramoyl-L-alanine amidase-like protein